MMTVMMVMQLVTASATGFDHAHCRHCLVVRHWMLAKPDTHRQANWPTSSLVGLLTICNLVQQDVQELKLMAVHWTYSQICYV